MKWLSFLVISVLLTESLCLDIQPLKDNRVSKLLKDSLGPLFDILSNTSLSLSDIDLGEDVGRFSDPKISFSGGLTHEIDGRGSWGFSLKVEMKNVQLGSQYDIKHWELPKLFPIYGKGDLKVAVERLSLDMVFAAVYNGASEKFDITVPTFNLSAGTAKVRFESLMDNLAVTEFLNQLISDLVPDLVTTVNEPLHEIVKKISDHYGNGILYCVRTQPLTVEKCIEDFLKGPSEDELPTRLAGIVAEVVQKNLLKYNFTK